MAHYSRVSATGDEEIDFRNSSAFEYTSNHQLQKKYQSIFKYTSNDAVRSTGEKVSYHSMEQFPLKREFFPNLGTRCLEIVITIISYILFVLGLPLSLFLCIKKVKPNERAVVFRIGRLKGARGPGRIIIFPCIDQCKCVNVRTQAFNIPPLQIFTDDGAIIEVGATVYFCVTDAVLATTSVQNLSHSLRDTAQHITRTRLSKMELSDIQKNRHSLCKEIVAALNDVISEWGAHAENIEMSHIKVHKDPDPPPGVAVLKKLFGGGDTNNASIFSTMQAISTSDSQANRANQANMSIDELTEKVLYRVRQNINETLVSKIQATYVFVLEDDTNKKAFFLDLASGAGTFNEVRLTSVPAADVKITLSKETLGMLMREEKKPFDAYMSGDLLVDGHIQTAMQLEEVFKL